MLGLAGIVLIAIGGAFALGPDLPRPVDVHLLLAAGALPLILGAIGYFTPVLTQTAAPPRRLAAAPALGLLAGVAAVLGLQVAREWLVLAILLGFSAAGGLLVWTAARARACLGDPHPCLRWYQAALVCHLLALGAAAVAVARGGVPLRNLHLHLNLLGFVGLAAVGTLYVLIPTACRFSDASIPARLHRGLPFALGGSLLVAVGAGWPALRPLAYLGGACWLAPLGSLVTLIARHRRELSLSWHGSQVPLLLAVAGLALALLVGGASESLGVAPQGALSLFGLGFLAPLVTGALAHLLPVWRWPGPSTPARDRASRLLGWGNGLRALGFQATAVAAVWGSIPGAERAGGLLAGLFLAQAALAFGKPGHAQVGGA